MLGNSRRVPSIRDRDLSKEELGQLIELYETMLGFFKEFDELRPQFAAEPCIKFVCGGLDEAQKIVNGITDRIECGASLPGGLIEDIPLPVAAPKPVRRRTTPVARPPKQAAPRDWPSAPCQYPPPPHVPPPPPGLAAPTPPPLPVQTPPKRLNWLLKRIWRRHGPRTS